MRLSTLLPVLLAAAMTAATPTPLQNAAVEARQICYEPGEDCSDFMYVCCPCYYCYTDPQQGTSTCEWNIYSSGCD